MNDEYLEWLLENKTFVDNIENTVVKLAVATKSAKGEEKIEALQKLIDYYFTIKKEFYTKGGFFAHHFSITWEHCNNAKRKDFEYITPYTEQLLKLRNKKSK